MLTSIIVLSGNVGAGKTTLANLLVDRFSAVHIKTHSLLTAIGSNTPRNGRRFRVLVKCSTGRQKGRGFATDYNAELRELPNDSLVVLDSVKIAKQIEAIRASYGRKVVHVHLTADLSALRKRYSERTSPALKELPSYSAVRENETERRIDELAEISDVLIRTDRSTPEDVLVRVASHVGLYGRESRKVVDVIIGGAYGSEGKGQIAAYLAPEYNFLLRVGGPNAGHSVYEVPRPYVFHHLPSGSRVECELDYRARCRPLRATIAARDFRVPSFI